MNMNFQEKGILQKTYILTLTKHNLPEIPIRNETMIHHVCMDVNRFSKFQKLRKKDSIGR